MNKAVAKEKTTIYLPPTVRRFAKMRAASKDTSLSDYVAEKIVEEMEDLEDIKTIERVMRDPETEWIAWEDAIKELEADGQL